MSLVTGMNSIGGMFDSLTSSLSGLSNIELPTIQTEVGVDKKSIMMLIGGLIAVVGSAWFLFKKK